MKILIVEDEEMLNNIITKRLKVESMIVDQCYDGESGLDYISTSSYDVIIMDIMMPKIDGHAVVKQMRAEGNKTPVLFLTAKDALEDKVSGLNLGADDYLVKPFEFDELIARIYALARRGRNQAVEDIIAGPLRINQKSRSVLLNGSPVVLTAKEFDLLFYLVSNPNIVLSRQQILDHVWEYDYESYSNLIDVYIKDLRKKVDIDDSKKLIQTVRGVGYVFRTEE